MQMVMIYNHGQISLGSGFRRVLVQEGSKWVHLYDWTTLEHVKVDRKAIRALKPEPVEYNPRKVCACINRRIKYIDKGRKMWRDIVTELKGE